MGRVVLGRARGRVSGVLRVWLVRGRVGQAGRVGVREGWRLGRVAAKAPLVNSCDVHVYLTDLNT